MPSTPPNPPITLTDAHFQGIHAFVVDQLKQKQKAIVMSPTMFAWLRQLVDLAHDQLRVTMDEYEDREFVGDALEHFFNVDKALEHADVMGEFGNTPDVRLVLLSDAEVESLQWMLTLSEKELDSRMVTIEQCTPIAADKIRNLHAAGLSEVIAVIKTHVRDVQVASTGDAETSTSTTQAQEN